MLFDLAVSPRPNKGVSMKQRSPMDLVHLADRIGDHCLRCGLTLSTERLAEYYHKVDYLFNRAADDGLGRGGFGAPHGAANVSKYGYMFLKEVNVERREIEMLDYYDWNLRWLDHDWCTGDGIDDDEAFKWGEAHSDLPQLFVDLFLKLRPTNVVPSSTPVW